MMMEQENIIKAYISKDSNEFFHSQYFKLVFFVSWNYNILI